MTRQVDKVVVYITRGDRLLVFTQPEFPEAGLQVPARTIEPGETPEEAARREAREETGLKRLGVWTLLGERERDMVDFGRDEVQRRYFFHARCDDPNAPDRW
jgi:8-oxo-dGTP diphosphatase